jgi:small-conductance mechanosensitive channel
MNQNFIYIGIFLSIILVTITIAFLVNRFFKRLIHRSTADMKNDPTNYLFLRHTLIGIIYIVGFSIAIYKMPDLRALASSLLAGAGILAVAVGFASQHALSNIISGVFIVIFKPFRVHDRLKVREFEGLVEDITLRHTVIRNFENKRILIPNTMISEEVITNSDFTESRICKWIDVGISYDSDIDRAKEIMFEEVMNHPLHIDGRTPEQIEIGAPEVFVRVLSLGEYSINLRAWAWAKDSPDAFVMSCDLYESIKKRYDKEGIEIPFPYRTLQFKNSPENIA